LKAQRTEGVLYHEREAMPLIEPEYQKLAEAEYFFRLLQADWSAHAFEANLSAFLAALFSATEHNRLHCNDTRFADWYRQAKSQDLSHPDLARLKDFRNKEIHHKGVSAWQEISISIPEGVEVGPQRPVSWTVDLSSPEKDQSLPGSSIQKRYVWDTADSPDVLDLCEKGLQVVRQMLNSHRAMAFRR
jgi:hypothetical protein